MDKLREQSSAQVTSVRTVGAVLVLLAVGLCGCSTGARSPVTDAAILSDAKARSTTYCDKTEHGCEITVRRAEDGSWTAWVVPITLPAPDGRRYVGIDTDDMYFYRANGAFNGALRGYK